MSAHDLSDEVLREISHKYIKHPLRAQAHVIFSAIAGVNNDDEAKKNHIISLLQKEDLNINPVGPG
jgi:hypothetical protein